MKGDPCTPGRHGKAGERRKDGEKKKLKDITTEWQIRPTSQTLLYFPAIIVVVPVLLRTINQVDRHTDRSWGNNPHAHHICLHYVNVCRERGDE